MKLASPPAVIAGALVAGVFAARAATGVPAGWATRHGRALEADERYAEAVPQFERGAVGADRIEALWRASWARLECWYALPPSASRGPEGDELLRSAVAGLLEARADSPGSAWLTAALAQAYAHRETAFRSLRAVDLGALERGPWALVGDDGRVAIGLVRAAIDQDPNGFEARDQLVLLLEENGLHDDAVRAMGEAARVLPDFGEHPEFDVESLPVDLVEAFWRASRAVDAAGAPLQIRERHLLSLGQLGRRLGRFAEAEQDLRAALGAPGTKLAHAEDAFHLGLTLIDLGRLDEAETMLARAAEQPVFAPEVAETRARIAEKRGRWPEALDQLRVARRYWPRELGVLLEFARVAQKAGAWDQAEESLRWAMLVHPEDPEPSRALVEMFLARGDNRHARRALDEYVRSFGTTEDSEELEQTLAGALDPIGR